MKKRGQTNKKKWRVHQPIRIRDGSVATESSVLSVMEITGSDGVEKRDAPEFFSTRSRHARDGQSSTALNKGKTFRKIRDWRESPLLWTIRPLTLLGVSREERSGGCSRENAASRYPRKPTPATRRCHVMPDNCRRMSREVDGYYCRSRGYCKDVL